MLVKEDICPKSGLKREILYNSFNDNIIDKILKLNCDINYYNPISNEFLGTNILNKEYILITIDNIENIEGMGAYDHYKGILNDFPSMTNKGFTSIDSFLSYIILKEYLKGIFNK